MKSFNTLTVLSIMLLFAGFLSAQDCPDFPQNNLSRITENCQSGVMECLPIDFEFSGEYEYTLNGSPYNGNLAGCAFETTVVYDVLGIGNYPVNIDSWEVNGFVFSNIIANSPGGLADTMSTLSGVTWTFDDMSFRIESTNAPDSLGWLILTELNTGLNAEIFPQYSSVATQTAFQFPIGNNVFIAYNFIEDCADTLLIDVICEQITDTLVFNINVGDADSIFIDPSNLGMINYFVNECATQSGTSVDFQTLPSVNSLYFYGVAPGTEQACIVMCDVNGICDTTYVFVTVTDPPICIEPIVDSANVVDVNCDEPGSIQLFMQDQNQDYNFTWDNNLPNSNYVFDLSEGTYSVTITYVDSIAQPCFTTATYIVDFVDSLESYNYTIEPSCDFNGVVIFDNIGLTYTWFDGFVGAQRFDLPPGVFDVTVSSNNCEEVTTVVMPESTMDVTGSISNVCDTLGSIYTDVSGGFPPYSYFWGDGSTSPNRFSVDVGMYIVTVTDANGCTAEGAFEVVDDCPSVGCITPVITNVITVNPSCPDSGSIVIELLDNSLDYLFSWTHNGPNSAVQTGLWPGDYGVVVSNISTTGEVCSDTALVTLVEESSIVLNGFAANVCDTLGSIYLQVSGGLWPYTYQWSNGVTTLSQPELNVGIYTITVTDNGGCTLVQTYEIVDDCNGTGCTDPVIVSVNTVNPNCTDLGSIFLEYIDEGFDYTFDWSHGGPNSNIQTGLIADDYQVTITAFDPLSGTSCFTTSTFLLFSEDSLGFFLVNSTPADCGNTGSAEYSDSTLIYNWSDGGIGHVRSDLAAGDYEITVTSPNSTCEELTFLNIPEISTISYNAEVANVCDTLGSIYLFNPNGVYTYEWSNGSITRNQPALDVGVYSVTVTNDQGCTVSETFVVVDDCSGSGCVDPVIVDAITVNPNCIQGGMIDVPVQNMTPNLTYLWSNGSDMPQIIDLPAGTYTVTITDFDPQTGDTCAIMETFVLVAEDSLGFSLVNVTNAGCGGPGSAEYSDPTLIYNWSDGGIGHVRDDLAPGQYTITVTNDQETCIELTSLTILDAGAINVSSIVSNVCDTLGSIYLTVNGGTWPYTFDWADIPGNMNQGWREAVDVGTYSVTITDADGCTLDLDFAIVDDCPMIGDLIFTFIPPNQDILCGESAPIENPIAESDCPGDINYTFTETQEPNCGNTSILTREWIATDDCGNTASAQQIIFEVDIEEPEIITVGDFTVDLLNGDSLPDPLGFATAEDDCGIVADLSYTKEESITDDGYQVAYTWTAVDECGNFASAVHTVDVTGGMIWPGDTDSNKVVNNFDVFNIGFAYGETGPTRMSPTLDFLPQYAAPWSANGLDDVNFRHADTDGNGIVDEQDILAVNLNYDLTHNLQEQGDTRETFEIDFIYETVTADNWVHVAVLLGNTAEPIDDFYGAGFTIEYDQNMVVPNTAHVDFSESWTGTFFNDFVALQKDFHDEGRLDVGLVRIDQQGVDGSGKIGSFRFQLPEGVEFTPFMLTARQGEGVRADKSPYELETVEVVVTNVKDILSRAAIDIYPNPVQTELFLNIPAELEVTDIQLFGTNGQMVQEYADVTTRTLEVDSLPAGLYYLRILTTEGTWTDKVSIMK